MLKALNSSDVLPIVLTRSGDNEIEMSVSIGSVTPPLSLISLSPTPSSIGSEVLHLNDVDDEFKVMQELINPTTISSKLNNYFENSIEQDIIRRVPAANSCENIKEAATNLIESVQPKKKEKKPTYAIQIERGHFQQDDHFYPQALATKIHPLVSIFFELGNERIIQRYKQLKPHVNLNKLRELLEYQPKYFKYAGCDLFKTLNQEGKRQMIIIETNSCPSGQKSMPLLNPAKNQFGGYRTIVESIMESELQGTNTDRSLGDLAVVYDKNLMESSAYCAVLAELSNEKVWFVEYYDDDDKTNKNVEWRDGGHMHVKDEFGQWHPIRACIRYVTQKPWNRLPLVTKTKIVNPIVACLAGGRNKIVAAHAYQQFNDELTNYGLHIRMPSTKLNVTKNEIPEFIASMGGHAVIKEPYGNCGVGVYTITNELELANFMNTKHYYDKFIVQSLVGHIGWRKENLTKSNFDEYYHIGTVVNEQNETFVYDLRMVVTANSKGFRPVSFNGRRARQPLVDDLNKIDPKKITSWDMLGTNLSIKVEKNVWDTESKRLLLMDRDGFDQLGLSLDDLIDGYIQTVMASIAIDKMCIKLLDESGIFNYELYKDLNFDDALFDEFRA